MGVYKRGRFWWYDFTVAGQRYRGSTELTAESSKTAAKAVERRERERAALGVSDPLTIEQAAGRWFIAKKAGKKSAQGAAQSLEVMLRLIGPHTLVSQIGGPEIAAAVEALRLEPTRQSTQRAGSTPKALSSSTVNRILIDTTLRPILNYCDKTLEIPVRSISWADLRLEEPTERTRTFTAAEVSPWDAALPPWHRPVRGFLERYGVRLKEAFFPLSAIDTVAWRITIRPASRKNKRAHTIRLLPEDAADVAARLGRARAAGLDTIWFREMPSGELRPIHWRAYQSASRKALDRAGIEDARPAHDLRHHAATTLLRLSKGNLAAVQRMLGHKNLQSTMRYSHLTDDDVYDAMWHAYVTEAPQADEKTSETNDKAYTSTGT